MLPSIKNARNRHKCRDCPAEDMSCCKQHTCDADNATVTPDTSAAQTSDENDDNPLLDDVSDPDVDACLRVLDRITKDPAAFGTPQHRKLRGAVRAPRTVP